MGNSEQERITMVNDLRNRGIIDENNIDTRLAGNLKEIADKINLIGEVLSDIYDLWSDTEDMECGNLTGYEMLCWPREYPFKDDMLEAVTKMNMWSQRIRGSSRQVESWQKHGLDADNVCDYNV